MKKSINFIEVLTSLSITVSLFLLSLVFYFQPKISDDWYALWQYQTANDLYSFWFRFYSEWTGRLPVILLNYLILPNPLIEKAYRLFIPLQIITLIGLSWYCSVGVNPFSWKKKISQPFILYALLLWLSLPARNETISWLGDNFAFLVPGILGLLFIATSKIILKKHCEINNANYIIKFFCLILYSLIGFMAGSSQEQVIVFCVSYTIISILGFTHEVQHGSRIYNNQWCAEKFLRTKSISLEYCFLICGFLMGSIFLISSAKVQLS